MVRIPHLFTWRRHPDGLLPRLHSRRPAAATAPVDAFTRTAGRRAQAPALPMPATPLVQYVAAAFSNASPGNMRSLLPRLLAGAFPWPDTDTSLGDVTVYKTLTFCLQDLQARHTNATLRSRLPALQEQLTAALGVAMMLASTPDPDPRALVDGHILAPLAANRPALVSSGYANPNGSHAVTLLFAPQGANVRLVVFNRGEGSEQAHLTDGRGRSMPLVIDLPSAGLRRRAGRRALRTLMRLQRPDPAHTIEAFYDALEALRRATGGTLRLGDLGGVRRRDLLLPAQSPQTAGTCTLHSNWAWLRYALYIASGCDMRASEDTYKNLKAGCRRVLIEQALAVHAEAVAHGDAPLAESLAESLRDVQQWLAERLDAHPGHRPLGDRLQRWAAGS